MGPKIIKLCFVVGTGVFMAPRPSHKDSIRILIFYPRAVIKSQNGYLVYIVLWCSDDHYSLPLGPLSGPYSPCYLQSKLRSFSSRLGPFTCTRIPVFLGCKKATLSEVGGPHRGPTPHYRIWMIGHGLGFWWAKFLGRSRFKAGLSGCFAHQGPKTVTNPVPIAKNILLDLKGLQVSEILRIRIYFICLISITARPKVIFQSLVYQKYYITIYTW